jgi:hypothetical protein
VGDEFLLDSWSVHISAFASAASHLAWPGTCLTLFYRQDGPHDQPPCPTIGTPKWKKVVTDIYRGAHRASGVSTGRPAPTNTMSKEVDFSESPTGLLLMPVPWVFTIMPEEYATPPDDWPLPTTLAKLVEELIPTDAAQRFFLFMWRSKVRLTKVPAPEPALAGVGDPVGSTTIEAVCDSQNRPLALWLRTPEPIDWRRIHAEMTLRHVEPDTSCPTSYANRKTMELSVRLLPSTDGSGTLLIALLDGISTRLPRGEITLKLTYDPSEPGLAELRPGTSLPSDHETLSMTFLQPFGQTWPVKPTGPLGRVLPPKKLVPKPRYGPPDAYRTQNLKKLIKTWYEKEMLGG